MSSTLNGGAPGPVGKQRDTLAVLLLSLVTFGLYSLYYFYATHEEMKRYSGTGIGGVLGLVLAIFLGLVTAFTLPLEVGGLYERAGRQAPVSVLTGLWYLLPLIGGLVWLFKVNGALNRFWEMAEVR